MKTSSGALLINGAKAVFTQLSFLLNTLLFFHCRDNRKRGDGGGGNSGRLNMGLSSGLTPQMDLIVLRNSIFCHSVGTLRPSPGPPRCSRRGALINSTQGVELRNWVLPRIKPWESGVERERRGGRLGEVVAAVGGGCFRIILQMLPLSHLDTSHTRSLPHHVMCTCSSAHTAAYCIHNTHNIITHEHTHTHTHTHTLKHTVRNLPVNTLIALPLGKLLYALISSVIF